MRRQDIQLLARARQGDNNARCEVGRRYLLGVNGFTRHVPTALSYLRHPGLAGELEPARILAKHLPLEQLMGLGQMEVLPLAAAQGCTTAQCKLGLWHAMQAGGRAEAQHWLGAAAASGHIGAQGALSALDDSPAAHRLLTVLHALDQVHGVQGASLARLAAQQALDQGQLPQLQACLHAALALAASGAAGNSGTQPALAADGELAGLLVAAAQLARRQGQTLQHLPAEALREALAQRAGQGDRDAAYTLGCGLSGLDTAGLQTTVFAEHQNLRKGAAFLLRAADAGCDDAWLHLYRLHADHRSSVANPQLARFFLEKAAARGQAEAQRKLGALQLREAQQLADSEQAIHWLHSAALQDDEHARTLLQSLVLPVADGDAEAQFAVEQVRRLDPWLAQRLALSRAFGLTKLEALCVDPVDGQRDWGLVVGRNPFISQVRLSAPRAVPAVSGPALATAQQAARFFDQALGDGAAAEGDLRARSLRQRRVFDRLGLDESLFFSGASSVTLDTLRQGAKWAYRARQPLNQALAA